MIFLYLPKQLNTMILAHFVGDRINLMRRSYGGDQKLILQMNDYLELEKET